MLPSLKKKKKRTQKKKKEKKASSTPGGCRSDNSSLDNYRSLIAPRQPAKVRFSGSFLFSRFRLLFFRSKERGRERQREGERERECSKERKLKLKGSPHRSFGGSRGTARPSLPGRKHTPGFTVILPFSIILCTHTLLFDTRSGSLSRSPVTSPDAKNINLKKDFF